LFSIRFINKLTKDDFFPTYIISRHFESESSKFFLNLSNIKQNLFKDGLVIMDNINRYSIDNTLVWYTRYFGNNVNSIFDGVPYNFNFVMNYITNNLGNSYIIQNYINFYYAAKDIIGNQNMKHLIKIIDSYDEALKVFDKKNPKLILVSYDFMNITSYLAGGFNNRKLFEEYVNKNMDKLIHGFWIRDLTIVNNMLRMKNDHAYFIRPFLLFTFINNELKCYVWKDIAYFIYQEIEEQYYDNKEFIGSNYLIPPQILTESFNTYSSKHLDIDNLIIKIRKVCSILGKTYKKYVNLTINQMNGFISVAPSMGLFYINDTIEPVIQNLESAGYISQSKNYEMSKWIYDLAISPALYPDFKCNNQELHYQPLDID